MGVPPDLRGRVWKCLLSTDSLRENSDFNYQVKYKTFSGNKILNLVSSLYGNVACCGTSGMGNSFTGYSKIPKQHF